MIKFVMIFFSVVEGSDEELSGAEDDPDLLNELSEIAGGDEDGADLKPEEPISPVITTPPSIPDATPQTDEPILPTTTMSTVELIKSRIEMYKLAEKIAKESGDSSRARSRGRGVKSLESLLKQAIAGKPINPDDIPPVVSVKPPNAPETPTTVEAATTVPEIGNHESAPESVPVPAPSSPKPATPDADDPKIKALLARQHEYKVAALTAKKSGNTAMALQYVKIIKVFDAVLASARNGEAVDLSDMPPPPSELSSDLLKAVEQSPQTPSEPAAPATPSKQENLIQQSTESDQPEPPKPKAVELPPPEVPKTILEALTQRLQKYQANEANAKAEGNDRKARQNGRIVKQYQDAIKAHKAGRQIAFDELPAPPGYPPIPLGNQPQPAQAPAKKPDAESPTPPGSGTENTSPKRSPMKRQESRVSGNHSYTSVMSKTIELLLERQKDFKDAALEAKKAGEIEQAKEYLKTFKGIENLLNVAKGGLPVDLSTVSISTIASILFTLYPAFFRYGFNYEWF